MLITIAFEGAAERDIALRLPPEHTLQHARAVLAARAGLQPDERFLIDNAGLDPAAETDTTVADLLGEGRTLRVRARPAAPVTADPPPVETAPPTESAPTEDTHEPIRVQPPDTTPSDAAWNLTPGESAQDMIDRLRAEIAEVEAGNVDVFATLPLRVVRTMFVTLGLDLGLRFDRSPKEIGLRSSMAPVTYLHPQRRPSFGPDGPLLREFAATASHALHELRQRGIHATHASGSFAGFGLDASFRQDLERLRRHETTAIHLSLATFVPRVRLRLDPRTDLRASDALLTAVAKVLDDRRGGDAEQYRRLHRDVFHPFGYFFPCEVVLGGHRIRTLQIENQDREEQEQLVREFKLGGAADVQTPKGRVEAAAGSGHSNQRSLQERYIDQLRREKVQVLGGDEALGLDDAQEARWVRSLDRVATWRVIGNRELRPILHFLPPALAQPCVALIDTFARRHVNRNLTALDMTQYIAPANHDMLLDLL